MVMLGLALIMSGKRDGFLKPTFTQSVFERRTYANRTENG